MASAQHGVISRCQLVDLGFSGDAIDRRIAARRLHPIHRGVFAVGHPLVSLRGRWMAAVLAGGPGAILSHRSAAALYGILAPSAERVHVTVPRRLRSRRGLVFHRGSLPADEVGAVEGIPVTGPSRTILDLAAHGTPAEVERALREADVRRLDDLLSLDDLLARYPGRQGTARVRAALAEHRLGATATKSELEERFLAFLCARRLPRPERNAMVHARGRWLEVDCLWRGAGLVVELDSHAFHANPHAFESDRERDRILQAAGLRVVRVTWRHLELDAGRLEADLRAVLAGGGRL